MQIKELKLSKFLADRYDNGCGESGHMRSTSAALTHALVELLIFTLYHFGAAVSPGIVIESVMMSIVPSGNEITRFLSLTADPGSVRKMAEGGDTTA